LGVDLPSKMSKEDIYRRRFRRNYEVDMFEKIADKQKWEDFIRQSFEEHKLGPFTRRYFMLEDPSCWQFRADKETREKFRFPEEVSHFCETSVPVNCCFKPFGGEPHESFTALYRIIRDDPNKDEERLFAESVWEQMLRVYTRWQYAIEQDEEDLRYESNEIYQLKESGDYDAYDDAQVELGDRRRKI